MATEKRTDSKGRELYCGEYERKDGRYSYRYTTMFGEKKTIYAHRLSDLRNEEAKILYLEHINISKKIFNITLNDQFEIWFAAKQNIRENTKADYKYFYDRYIRNSLGKMLIDEITAFDIKCHYMSLNVNGRISAETISHIQNVLYQVLKSGVERNVIFNNPAKDACKEFNRKHSKHTSIKSGMSVKQAEDFLKYVEKSEECMRWYPLFYFMINTGLRISEVAGLRWEDIDFNHNLINVNHSIVYHNRTEKQAAGLRGSNLKNDSSHRIIPIKERTKEVLLLEKKYQEEKNIQCNTIVDGYTDFIFLNRYGNVIREECVNRALKRAVFLFNSYLDENDSRECRPLPLLTSHSLRHTFANYLCENNVNIKVAQKLLGHTDIETTMNIYTSVSREYIEKEYYEKF